LCAGGDGYFWGTIKGLNTEGTAVHGGSVFLDWICAGILFVTAIVDSLLVPRTYTGRIWIFGTVLALMFTAMLNILRIRNDGSVKGLKLFCITANVTMLFFVVGLIASIGKSRTVANPQVVLVGGLLLVETIFSLRKKA